MYSRIPVPSRIVCLSQLSHSLTIVKDVSQVACYTDHMTEETESPEYEYSEDDIEYDSSVKLPSPTLQFMVKLGGVFLAAAAGYCIGWAADLVYRRLTQ